MDSLQDTMSDLNRQAALITQNQKNEFKPSEDGMSLKYAYYYNTQLRIIDFHGQLWFSANDVCRMLGFRNGRDAIRRYVSAGNRWAIVYRKYKDTPLKGLWSKKNDYSNKQFISEKGMNLLILRSHVVGASVLKKWLAKKVLPSLAHHKSYSLPKKHSKFVSPNHFLVQVGQLAKDTLRLTDRLKSVQPYVDHDKTLSDVPNSAMSFKVFDTYLQQRKLFPYGMRILFRFSRNMGFLGKKGSYHNQPLAKYKDFFNVKRCLNNRYAYNMTLVNNRGQRMYIELLKKMPKKLLNKVCNK